VKKGEGRKVEEYRGVTLMTILYIFNSVSQKNKNGVQRKRSYSAELNRI